MDYLELSASVEPRIPGTDILIAELADIGFESFEETPEGCRAWIQVHEYDEFRLSKLEILANPDYTVSWKIEHIPSRNWNEEWEKNFQPIEINESAVIRASFHQREEKYRYEFLISPKMAFGTGHHETTWMMANKLFVISPAGKTVLDMGCGTGILAVIAEKLGAASVVAIDIEEPSVDNTLEHIALNDCSRIDVRLGDAALLGKEKFDMILANINRNVLMKDLAAYVPVLNRGGHLLLSGFFSTDVEMLSDKATNLGLSFVSVDTKNNWAQLTFVFPG